MIELLLRLDVSYYTLVGVSIAQLMSYIVVPIFEGVWSCVTAMLSDITELPPVLICCRLQAMDRCHRIGQRKPVLVFRLATALSVEGKLLKRANSKLALERLVIKKGAFLPGQVLSCCADISFK